VSASHTHGSPDSPAHDHGHGPGGHDHGHAGHSHAPSADADRRWLTVALALIAGFMGVEIAAGVLAGSLALLSDAGHMLTDAASIGLALVAARFAARPAAGAYTFGFGRAEILSAQVNGAALFLLAGIIAVEGFQRLGSPHDVDGAIVILVGVVGAVVNVAAFWALSRSERQSLNVAGARAHVLADLYGSGAAIVAGVVIVSGGPAQVDAIAALTVAALMLRSGWSLMRASMRVLLEAAPHGIDPDEVGHALAAHRGVVEVHDLHVWEVTSGFPALAAHVIVAPDDDCHGTRRELQTLLRERFGIRHTTLQVDHESWHELVEIEPRVPAR
jgi:cobalt-zinc-cadmium efflux system protein